MSETDKQRLMYAVLNYLEEEIIASDKSPDEKEALEVASQCIENVYAVKNSEPEVKAKLALPGNLLEIFKAGCKIMETEFKPKEVSSEDKLLADQLKTEGNELMKQERFKDAIEQYGRALQIDPRNSVYFCNRAAAYSKVDEHSKALEDCMKALEIDPNYSKAYGRKGLAHSALDQHYKAKECFERALELDPQNESYKSNLKVADEKVAELEQQQAAATGFGGGFGLGGGNFMEMLNNPGLMQMASQMMQNPQMQNMMQNMMQTMGMGAMGGEPEQADGAGGEHSNPPAGMPDIQSLLTAGQRLADQMRQQNPELIEQLRSVTQPPPGPGSEGQGQQ